MSKRGKKAVWIGGVIFILAAVLGAVFWANRRPVFTLPDGRQLRLEAVTWRPENRVAKLPFAEFKAMSGRLLGLLGYPGYFQDTHFDLGDFSPGVVWLAARDATAISGVEVRLLRGTMESPPLREIGYGMTGGSGRALFAHFMETVPQDTGPLSLRVYHREGAGKDARLLGEVRLKPSVVPRQGAETNLVTALVGTNDHLTVSFVDWQVPAETAPPEVADPSLLRLRIEETARPGLVSTNWEIASVMAVNRSGDMMVQHVDNRGHADGMLKAGLRPPWSDGQLWKLRIGLVRGRNFPETNHIRFASVPMPSHTAPSRGVTAHVGGAVFNARLDLGREPDPLPEATNWLASVLVTIQGHHGESLRHLRWVRFTDQRGTNHTILRYGWGGDRYRFGLTREEDFVDGTVVSGDLVVSWEPVLFVDLVAAPRPVTNFTDWPTRKPPPGKTPAHPEAPTEVSRP